MDGGGWNCRYTGLIKGLSTSNSFLLPRSTMSSQPELMSFSLQKRQMRQRCAEMRNYVFSPVGDYQTVGVWPAALSVLCMFSLSSHLPTSLCFSLLFSTCENEKHCPSDTVTCCSGQSLQSEQTSTRSWFLSCGQCSHNMILLTKEYSINSVTFANFNTIRTWFALK